jgi:hypothetical protein
MEGTKILENIFFGITCISIFTCLARSDYNFAMGLLCYYMIKGIGQAGKNVRRTARTVSKFSFEKISSNQFSLTL